MLPGSQPEHSCIFGPRNLKQPTAVGWLLGVERYQPSPLFHHFSQNRLLRTGQNEVIRPHQLIYDVEPRHNFIGGGLQSSKGALARRAHRPARARKASSGTELAFPDQFPEDRFADVRLAEDLFVGSLAAPGWARRSCRAARRASWASRGGCHFAAAFARGEFHRAAGRIGKVFTGTFPGEPSARCRRRAARPARSPRRRR